MTFLIADGVVPSNEDRGYVLRRVIRRAILQGRHTLGLDPGFLGRYADVVTELMGVHYRELPAQRELVQRWLSAEEEGFGRTLAQGSQAARRADRAGAGRAGAEGIAGADAFRLHDTYGFPIDLTLELVAEHELGVDEAGFEVLMDEQRTARPGQRRARTRRAASCASGRSRSPARRRRATEFVGYETVERETTVAALAAEDGPAAGQARGVAVLRHRRRPDRRRRLGRVPRRRLPRPGRRTSCGSAMTRCWRSCPSAGALQAGERVRARVDRAARHATECNHTATHLLHAALRGRLGDHVHQAGSYVGPDKLRFDFTHGSGLSAEELARRRGRGQPLGAREPSGARADDDARRGRRLGAMALFGEKYGDVVRMVEVGDGSFSRELCGGTHVRDTSEIGLFTRRSARARARPTCGGSRRVTGPGGGGALRARDAQAGGGGRTSCGSRRARRGCGPRAARPRAGAREGRAKAGGAAARASTSTRCSRPRPRSRARRC